MPLLRALAMLAASAAIASCTLNYDVRATFVNGRLAFMIEDDTAERPQCPDSFAVEDEDGTTMWEFSMPRVSGPQPRCQVVSPLIYGKAPAGASTIVPARPLVSGHLYLIEGWGDGSLSGAFRYRSRWVREVGNLSYQEAERVRVRRSVRAARTEADAP